MIAGTLDQCRRAAETIIARMAAMHGYTPENVHEELRGDKFLAVWDTPDGKMMCEYRASGPDANSEPLNVSEELLQQQRDMRARVAELEKQIGNA